MRVASNWQGRQVYLIGRNRLRNELLAYVVPQVTKASCEIIASLAEVPTRAAETAKRILLYDASSDDDIPATFGTTYARDVLQHDYVVLSNLPPVSGLERAMLKLGVRGFICDQSGIDTLLIMIDALYNDGLWVPQQVISELLSPEKQCAPWVTDGGVLLTSRETDILASLSKGLSNAKIADVYCLSPYTVKTHIYNIYKKIAVRNRIQAAQWVTTHT